MSILQIIPLYQHILVKIQRLPESLATLESLAPILDSVFRKRVPSLAAEAFVDYWKLTYSRMPTPERGWPKSIRHCLSITGLLAIEDCDDNTFSNVVLPSPLGTAFSLPPSSPRTPISASFSTPPTAILKREAMSKVPSPQRPTKAFGGFPIVPSTPPSPVRRRTRSSIGARTPLSEIQLCGSPSKRRRLMSEGEGRSLEEKENVAVGGIVSVAERIALNGQKTGAASKKRRYEEEEDGEDYLGGRVMPTPAKKLKSRMKPKVKPTLKNTKLKEPSPALSAASSNESEDERWVEQAVGVAFPSTADGSDEQRPPVLTYRRPRSNGSSPEEPGQLLQQRPQPRIVSLDGQPHSAPPVKIDLRTVVPLRRSTSISEFASTAIQKKRKRADSDSSDFYDRVIASDAPLAALPLRHAAKRAFTIPLSDPETSLPIASSDDDPHLGQVTPHHIISPAPQSRAVGRGGCGGALSTRKNVFNELFGDDDAVLGSDDSIPSPTSSSSSSSESEVDSPTKQVLLRHLRRTAL